MAKVDLTEDEVYSHLHSVSNSKGNSIYDALRSADIPWDFSSSFTLLRIVRTEAELTPLVFTGDAETVNFMKEVAEVEEGKRCDCCGQLITTPLWDMPYGSLCDECSKRLDGQVHVMQGVSGSHNGKADGYYNTNGNAYPYYKCKFVVKNEGIVFA